MIKQTHLLLTAALLFSATSSLSAEEAEFEPLLQRLPAGANALVMLNADQIFASDLATREGWRSDYEENYAKSPLLLPPEAQQFVLAAQMDLGSFTPRWESAVMRLGSDPSLSMVSRMVKGSLDKVGGLEAVVTPRGAYILRFDEGEYGLMAKGDRQSVVRWVRGQGSPTPLSPYLQKASSYPDRVGTEIIQALDLAGAVSRDSVRAALDGSEVMAKASIDRDRAADTLASLEGVMLGIRVTERAYGSLRVDFSEPIDVIAPVAKEMLLEVLEQAGLSIDEFYDWEVQTEENSFRISGELTKSGLTRVFSFLEIDSSVVGAKGEQQAAASGDSKYGSDVEKTVEYFHAVENYLEDLDRERGAKSYYTIATWFEKYAKRIDRLPILGVDPDLVDFSAHVVEQLLDCSEAIRGAGINSGARSATVSGSGYSGSYSGYTNTLFLGSEYADQVAGVRSAEADRIAIRKQERAASSTTVRGITRQLKTEVSSMRRGLTQKYQVEF